MSHFIFSKKKRTLVLAYSTFEFLSALIHLDFCPILSTRLFLVRRQREKLFSSKHIYLPTAHKRRTHCADYRDISIFPMSHSISWMIFPLLISRQQTEQAWRAYNTLVKLDRANDTQAMTECQANGSCRWSCSGCFASEK